MPSIEELAACTKCQLAILGRQHVVPGQDNADSPDFMFIGEAPGADEDRQGLAFVGAAGQFLAKISAAMGYTREQIFIANICKCRPSNNRTPNPQEMEACLPYLRRQIAAIRPKCIVLLGRTAMNGLFPTQRIRRCSWYEYKGIPTIFFILERRDGFGIINTITLSDAQGADGTGTQMGLVVRNTSSQ